MSVSRPTSMSLSASLTSQPWSAARVVSLSVVLWCAGAACRPPATPGGTDLPLTPTRRIAFTTDEGTWLSLDVSPDGRTIVFDLLGDLYTLPITGGKATRLTRGMAYDATPRFSPDGSHIAFVSDRSGWSQLWVMRADGTSPRQVTREKPIVGAPSWTPDGSALVAVWASNREAAAAGKLWRYDVATGAGAPVLPDTLPFPNPRGFRYLSPATVHPDGQRMWFSEWIATLPDARRTSALREFDLKSRTASAVGMPDSNGSRPQVSPDGHWLAYFAEQTSPRRTVLRLRDVRAGSRGTDRVLAAVEPQSQWLSNYTGYAFTPDSRAVILASGGKFVRVSVVDGGVTPIPFTAAVELDLGPQVRVPRKLEDGPLAVRQLSGVSRSPDGQRLVFSAVGKVWVTTGGTTATRLTNDSMAREFDPVFSPDGRWIAFATWSDAQGGRLWKVPAPGGAPVPLTADSARTTYYSVPRWTPDGTRLVFVAVPDYQAVTAFGARHGPGEGRLSWIAADGGAVHRITSIPIVWQYDRLTFDITVRGDSARVYYMHEKVLKSVGLDGGAGRTELTVDPGQSSIEWIRGVPSPDGQWLAMLNDLEVVALPWPTCAGTAACVVRLDQSPPLVAVSHGGGIQPSWSADGQWLSWVRGNTVFRARIAELAGQPGQVRPESVVVNLRVPRPGGVGTVVLRGARLITMASRGITRTPTADGGVRVTTDPVVIEQGDLLIRDRRIAALGPSGTVPVPRGATVIDVAGKTIIPGLIDLHADGFGHGARYAHTIAWDAPANLAYGVTTVRNPGVAHFDTGELVESGALLGPRFFGGSLRGAGLITNLSQARQRIRASKQLGGDWIKAGTNGESRRGQQLTLLAAGLEGINLTNHWYEGSVQDGNTGLEHSRFSDQTHRLYRDWVELTARAGTTWTPTLVVAFRHHRPWKEQHTLYERFERCVDFTSPKLRRFLPPLLVPKNEAGEDRLRCDPSFGIGGAINAARSARDVLRAGGNVAASSHGNTFEGIMMVHWELETMVHGGMTPAEALSAGTLHGARGLGLDADLGSLEVGKLADLVVLDRNPLEDIRHTLAIRFVMKSGVLYDGNTLDERWPVARPFAGNPWGRKGGQQP